MNFKGVIKYKIFRFKKIELTEDEFCDKLRTGKQKELIKKVNELGTNVSKLDINWDYISSHDKLKTSFINEFQEYINFDNYSANPNLTINKIRLFKDKLNWNILSRFYKFTVKELFEFNKYLNWQYIFFYQNLTANQVEKYFPQHMWWLFINDEIETETDKDYNKTKNLIIHKNIRDIPEEFCDAFKTKLKEYQENKKQLKQTLKTELCELINDFNKNGEVNELRKITITVNGFNNEVEEVKEEDKTFSDGTTQYELETTEKEIQVEEEKETTEKEIQVEEEEETENPFEKDDNEMEEEEETENPFEMEEGDEKVSKMDVLEAYDEPSP